MSGDVLDLLDVALYLGNTEALDALAKLGQALADGLVEVADAAGEGHLRRLPLLAEAAEWKRRSEVASRLAGLAEDRRERGRR